MSPIFTETTSLNSIVITRQLTSDVEGNVMKSAELLSS